MKTILISAAGALAMALLFSSCSSNLRTEKRHYRNGFYTDWFSSATRDHAEQNTTTENPEDDASEIQELMVEVEVPCDTVQGEAHFPMTADTVHANVLRTTIPVIAASDAVVQDTVKKEKKLRKIFSYKGPPETKRAANLYRLGLLLIIFGLLCYLLVFLPTVPYVFGFLVWAFLAGIVVEIVAMILASERVGEFAGKNPELEAEARKIRRRALWAIIGALIARLVLLVTIILITMISS